MKKLLVLFACLVASTALAGRADPLRIINGQRYDFTEAYQWLAMTKIIGTEIKCEYAKTSALRQGWEYQKRKWQKYLVYGRLIEMRPDGGIMSVPVESQVQSGSKWVGTGWATTYRTVKGAKEIFVRNLPKDVPAPFFALPGGSQNVNGILLPAYDYGFAPTNRLTQIRK